MVSSAKAVGDVDEVSRTVESTVYNDKGRSVVRSVSVGRYRYRFVVPSHPEMLFDLSCDARVCWRRPRIELYCRLASICTDMHPLQSHIASIAVAIVIQFHCVRT